MSELGPRKDLFRVDGIDVVGVKKVEKEAILERIGVRKGMVLDNYLLKKDIGKIYGLKYFDWVEAHHIKRGRKKHSPVSGQGKADHHQGHF